MSHATFRSVCNCSTQIFFGHILVGYSSDDIGTGNKHVTGFVDHENKIGQGRRIDRPSGAWSQNCTDLRNYPWRKNVIVENVGITGQALHALLNSGATRVIKANKRSSVFNGHFLDLNNFISIRPAHRSSKNGEVLGKNIHQAIVNFSIASNDPITSKFLFVNAEIGCPMQHKLIDLVKCSRIKQVFNAFTGGFFSGSMLFFNSLLAPANFSFLIELF